VERLNDKNSLNMLASEAKVPRKVTIDVSSHLTKSTNHKGPENKNTIKHRYFAKLLIPNDNNLRQSLFVPSPPKKVKEEDVNLFEEKGLHYKKSLSYKNIADEMLKLEMVDERRPNSDQGNFQIDYKI
jgi:hypothetical protein